MMRVILCGVIYLSLVIGAASDLFACWGARPLSMGGAFIAVADDIHSIYWNPAGLAKVKDFELTYTRWLNRRDHVNYDDFVASAVSFDLCTLGMSFTYNLDEYDNYKHFVDDPYWWREIEDNYVNLGCGAFLGKEVAVGFNIKSLKTILRRGVNVLTLDTSSHSDTVYLYDFGLIWEADPKFSFGVLGQNFNEPQMFGQKWIFNLRPGIAWKPNKKFTLAVDLYDALCNSEMEGRDIRIGTEVRATENLALRLGGYHVNNSGFVRGYTGGLGLKIARWTVDYGFMYWEEANFIQHMLAFSYTY